MATELPQFPKRFLWGASTAAHQVEGGNHNQWTVSELEHAKARATQAEYHYGDLESWNDIRTEAKKPSNYVSADLADHFHRYIEDIALLKKMNMNAYRFSVEWSRIEPEEGAWNAEAIAHYKRYAELLKKNDIEPVVTLFHFTLPVWFANLGGFEKRRNIKYFVRFAEKILSELGTSARYIITINEPEVYSYMSYYTGDWPPHVQSRWSMYRVAVNLMTAHKRAAKVIHAMNRKYKVSIAKNSLYIYPGDDAWLTKRSAAVMQWFQDDYLLRQIKKHCDFLGVNYYMSQRVYGYRIHNPDERLNDMGWDMHPADIEYVLERLHRKYKLPILITENGLADGQDHYRKWWIAQTIAGMQRALANEVKLEGYLHWSLMDNFEWDKGLWPRFGLAAVDYTTGARELRPSAKWFGALIKKLRGI